MSPKSPARLSRPLQACLELLRDGPSAIVWIFCKTGTIDACERRRFIRDTGTRDAGTLRVFELTPAGRAQLLAPATAAPADLWG